MSYVLEKRAGFFINVAEILGCSIFSHEYDLKNIVVVR